jgi:hypothetical protein
MIAVVPCTSVLGPEDLVAWQDSLHRMQSALCRFEGKQLKDGNRLVITGLESADQSAIAA